MKKTVFIIVFVGVSLSGIFGMGFLNKFFNVFSLKCAEAQEKKESGAEVMVDLRNKALAMKQTDLDGIKTVGEHGVYGVIMETGYDEAVVTLATFMTGDASLYFSSGGGMIGGVGHETVRNAVFSMNQKADEYVNRCTKTTEFPMPDKGQTIFYILTKDGVYTAEAVEDDLGNERHELSPLFYAGQNVITEFRLVTEKEQQ